MPQVTDVAGHASEGSGWHLPLTNDGGGGIENVTVVAQPTREITAQVVVAAVYDGVDARARFGSARRRSVALDGDRRAGADAPVYLRRWLKENKLSSTELVSMLRNGRNKCLGCGTHGSLYR